MRNTHERIETIHKESDRNRSFIINVLKNTLYAFKETGEVLLKMGKGILKFFGFSKENNFNNANSNFLKEQNRTLGLGDAEYRNQVFNHSCSAQHRNHINKY